MKTYNKKNLLILVIGILTTGLIVNTIYEISPNTLWVGIDQKSFEQAYAKDLEYIESTSCRGNYLRNCCIYICTGYRKPKKDR